MATTRAASRGAAPRPRKAQTASAKKSSTTTRKRKREESDDEDVDVIEVPKKTPKRSRRAPQECAICVEEKPKLVKNFPKVSSCNHEQNVCSECYLQQISANIEKNPVAGWAECTCPSCAQAIPIPEAKRLVPAASRRDLESRIREAKMRTAHNFLWCPAPDCGHGEQHRLTRAAFVTCGKCKTKICFNHRTVWHEGKTCQQYDDSKPLDAQAKKDMLEIRRTTKPCPFCKLRIRKEGGCNHMQCTNCRHHWQCKFQSLARNTRCSQRIGDSVPFDGETVGNGAEVAGGRVVVPGLVGEARENVNLVIEAMNRGLQDAVGRIAGPALAPRPVEQDPVQMPLQQPAHLRLNTVRFIERATTFFEAMGAIANTVRRTFTPETPTPDPEPEPQPEPEPEPERRTRHIRLPGQATRRSHRIQRLTHGRLTIDLTQGDDPEDLGTEIIDLTHED